jgi:LuxR family maltose regulon positive regulatory protein
MLDRLEHTNMFLVPLNTGQGWYRYHHLFRDFLRERLRREHPDWIPTLHRQAAAWYHHSGMAPAAIEHALAAGDYDTACDLLESVAEATTARGEYTTVHGWLERIPDGACENRPALSLWSAWDAILRGHLDLSERALERAERHWHTEGNRARLAEVWHARAHVARLRGNVDGTIRFARAALLDLPPAALTLRAGSMFALGAGYLMAGDLTLAETALEQARALCRTSNELALLAVIVAQGDLLVARGQLHDAIARYEEALALAGQRPITGKFEARILLAEIRREWNDLDRALAELRDALACAEKTSHDTHLLYGYIAMGRTLYARGEAPEAMAVLDRAVMTAQRLGSDAYLRQTRAQQVRLRLAQGDVEAGRRWRAGADLDPPKTQAGACETEYLVLARLLLAERRWSEAITLLQRSLKGARAQERVDSMVKIQVLRALALEGAGRKAEALHALEQAVTLAEPGGYLRTFLDEGPDLADLLRQGLGIGAWGLRQTSRGGLARGYARKLLAAFSQSEHTKSTGQAQPAVGRKVQTTSGGEALSGRELHVLRLIARGASNQEIADTLVISLGTVKSHLNHIMGKLGAHNRTEAVAHARALGWLP